MTVDDEICPFWGTKGRLKWRHLYSKNYLEKMITKTRKNTDSDCLGFGKQNRTETGIIAFDIQQNV